ncbi:MAG: M14 family zinc carboxypeptidase [Candidatus Marinimicrobia bacterium]|nr:M14 family zinc carboxypeptidase [Candidatus Neomarinimicrobiota bacterium]
MSYSSNPYYTYEKIDSTLQKWNDQFGSDESVNFPGKGIIFQLDTIGFSTQLSLPIFAVKISDNAPEIEDEIKVLILGQCHAEEVYGVEISMAIIDCFLNPNTCYQNQYIKSNFSPILNSSLENVELWVVPTHNPEGLKVVHGFEDAHGNWIEDASYRKNLRDANENDIFDWTAGIGQDFDGVDLNRNYNINWQFGDTLLQKTSSCNPYYNDDFDYYKGSHPFSESETQAIKDFTLKHNFTLSIAYHSSRSGCVAEKIIFPWGWKEKGNLDEYRKYSPDYPVIHSLATQMNTILGFSSSEGIKPQGSRTGNAHDWLYRETGCIQYLIEVGAFNYGSDGFTENNLLIDGAFTETIEKNLGTFFYIMMTASGEGISLEDQQITHALLSGIISDEESGLPVENAEIKIIELHADILKPRLTDNFGRYFRILETQMPYTLLVRAEGYRSDTLSLPLLNTGLNSWDIALEKLESFNLSWENNSTALSDDITLTITGEHFKKVQEGLSAIFLPEGDYTITISSPGYTPLIFETPVQKNQKFSIYLKDENPLLKDSFENLNNWNVISGDWIVSEGVLLSQSEEFYKNSQANSIQYSEIIPANAGEDLIFEFQMKYETEWKNDVLSIDYIIQEDTINIISLSGDAYNEEKSYYFPFKISEGLENGTLSLSFHSDYNLTYRGLAIDAFLVHLNEGNNLSISDSELLLPLKATLKQNYPNPFNPVTTIHYSLESSSAASIKLYNLKGEYIRDIVNKYHSAGNYSVQVSSHSLSCGIYFYRLDTGSLTINRKFVLIK